MDGTPLLVSLDIPGVKVDEVVPEKDGSLAIYITSTIKGTLCHRCGQEISSVHGRDREIRLRHLSILGKPTYLVFRPIRYICHSCSTHPTTTQRLKWYTQNCSVTIAYEDHVLKQLVNSTVADVSQKEIVGYDTIEDIVDRRVKGQVNWEDFKALPTLGIDDLSTKKGHKNFSTIITTPLKSGKVMILGVLKDRKKETVKTFLLSIPERLRNTVEYVCCDLYEGYTEAAREAFDEKVIITADRFHIAKLYRGGVDEARKTEMRRLKKELSETEYDEIKGIMWPLRKEFSSLSDEDKQRLTKTFGLSPTLATAYIFSNALTRIFETPYTKSEAEKMFRAWGDLVRNTGIGFFDKFLNTLNEKMDIITNYFVSRKNSGFVEGFNHKIRVLMARCYGIFNHTHIFRRLTLDTGSVYSMLAHIKFNQ